MAALAEAISRVEDLKQVERRTALIAARARRRKQVIKHLDGTRYWQLLSWLSEARTDHVRFLSLDEAVRFLSMQVRRANNCIGRNHHSAPVWMDRLPGLRDRLIVARYFLAHGAELWAVEVRAA